MIKAQQLVKRVTTSTTQ